MMTRRRGGMQRTSARGGMSRTGGYSPLSRTGAGSDRVTRGLAPSGLARGRAGGGAGVSASDVPVYALACDPDPTDYLIEDGTGEYLVEDMQ